MLQNNKIAKLSRLIVESYNGNLEEYSKIANEKTIKSAMAIFKQIKNYEVFSGDKIDRQKEINMAKKDLKEIFDIDTKCMSKNQIFLKHQSCLINAIYADILNNE